MQENKWNFKDPKSVIWPLLLLGAVTLYLLYLIFTAPVTQFDDTYMYLRYAHNLLSGQGYSWNGDGNTYGCTSIPYTFFITGVKAVFSELPNHRIVVFSAGFWAVLGLFLLGWTIYRVVEPPKRRHGLWITFFVVAFYSFNMGFRMNLFTGMDTMMGFFATTLLVLLSVEAGRSGKWPWLVATALAGWFAFLIRPDAGLYATLIPGLLFFLHFKMPKVKILVFYGFLAGFLLLDFFLKRHFFGSALPLPALVKSSGFYAGYIGGIYWNPIDYLADFALYGFPGVLLLLVFMRKRTLRFQLALLIPLGMTFLYYFTVTQIMGTHHRFYFPAHPLLLISGVWGFSEWLKEKDDLNWADFKAKIISRLPHVALFAGLWIMVSIPGSYYFARWFLTNDQVPQEQLERMEAHKLYHHIPNWTPFDNLSRILGALPKGSVVAASEHGILAAENPHVKIVDVMGLHDPEIAKNGFSIEYLASRDPQVIWMPHFHYVTLNYEIEESAWFQENYCFIPGVFKFGIAIRYGDKVAYEAVLKELQRVYPEELYVEYLEPERF